MSARENKRIVIIGAGPGGISCAIALKRKFEFVDVTIFEKGTWRVRRSSTSNRRTESKHRGHPYFRLRDSLKIHQTR
ncbi:hypothetical protein M413DRAFT_380030 [Hebeloma cylindrosporum]|uniref:FAD/NAD(P)-binding domain-containing protein n=1 Tax=Hebeloma cylindrosporum TaxID=76867 RepID=A0A0C3BSD6_HEBCY|nr:hypothetical protein M413DRAFT_380030 [Hebeloma cylindrosporum h7]